MANFADALREHYRADEWLRPELRDTGAFNTFVWKFKPFAAANVTPERLQFFDTPPDYQLRLEQAQKRPVRTTESTFLAGDAMLVLTAYECDSRAAARAHLLRLLGTFQGPVLERTDLAGEVAYAVPRAISAVTVRGNLVLYARNGGEELTSVAPLLQAIDERLTTEPRFSEKLEATLGERADIDGPFPLHLARPNADDWVHIVVHGGEVQNGEQGLVFIPAATAARLTIALISRERVAGTTIDWKA